jgi:cytochrome c biogenesis protein CcdA
MSSLYVVCAAFLGGLTSSLGPCLAPRYLLVAAQIAARATARDLAFFMVGSICGYLLFAIAGLSFAVLAAGSHVIYMVLSVGLVFYGIKTLLSMPCTCRSLQGVPGSVSSRFLLGISCTLMGSPCCAPIALALGLQAEQHAPLIAAATLLAFGLGHAAPILACVITAGSRRFRSYRLPYGAAATVSGTLLTAVGALYGLLA